MWVAFILWCVVPDHTMCMPATTVEMTHVGDYPSWLECYFGAADRAHSMEVKGLPEGWYPVILCDGPPEVS